MYIKVWYWLLACLLGTGEEIHPAHYPHDAEEHYADPDNLPPGVGAGHGGFEPPFREFNAAGVVGNLYAVLD